MSTTLQTPTGAALLSAVREAGLSPDSAVEGADFHSKPTARLSFGAAERPPLFLEITEGFMPTPGELEAGLTRHLRDLARRLRNPQPELFGL